MSIFESYESVADFELRRQWEANWMAVRSAENAAHMDVYEWAVLQPGATIESSPTRTTVTLRSGDTTLVVSRHVVVTGTDAFGLRKEAIYVGDFYVSF